MSTAPPRAHVFVIHGKTESLTHDAAIVPVDRALHFEEHWRELLGDRWTAAPVTWDQGWGRVAHRNIWLVEVGDDDYEAVLQRLTLALQDAGRAMLRPERPTAGSRELPLVALPALGIGAGGHAHERGKSIKDLMSKLLELARRVGVDLALVTPDPAVYAAAQFARRQSLGDAPLPGPLETAAQRLGGLARDGELALFLGAGVSIPAGLVSWTRLIRNLATAITTEDGSALVTEEAMVGLSATDQAELIERLDRDGFQERVVQQTSAAQRPSLLHALSAGLDVKEVVTTNYDDLYERAAEAARRKVKAIMPWASASGATRWILKLHGDIHHPKSIVLTRRHMVRFDATNRPSAAVLQSLFLTRHLLFIGTSFTDDNVIRLAHEVQAYREDHRLRETCGTTSPNDGWAPFGTVLDTDGDKVRASLWRDELTWVHHDDGRISGRRAVELLLDRTAQLASRNATWLLDPRFAGLLNEADRSIAEQAAQLFASLPSDSGTWSPLRARLEELGARRR
jgi:hypothetical protein